jgi:predicted transcriptional regulator
MPIIGKDFHPGMEQKIYNLKKTIEEQFPGLWKPTEACLSVLAQLLIKDVSNCFLLVFVGAPASRKTTVLQWFAGIDLTYRSDDFTPSSFVSHYAGATEEKLAEIDLLPRIKGKVLLTPELLPIFDAPYETLMRNMGIITRILDGQGYTSDSGVHGQRGYKGFEGDYVFHWLGAIALVPHRIWSLLGNMGPRIYFYQFPKEEEKEAKELAKELQDDFTNKTKICRNAVHNFISYLWNNYSQIGKWEKEKDYSSALEAIANLAMLLAKLRGNIEYQHVDEPGENGEESRETYTQPIIEEPHRANQVLYNLARGHALLYGRKFITDADIPLVTKIALNSANTDRVKLFEILLDNNGTATTKQFEERLDCSANMAIRTMTTLKILGLIDISKDNPGEKGGRPMKIAVLKPKFQWVLKQEFKALLKE